MAMLFDDFFDSYFGDALGSSWVGLSWLKRSDGASLSFSTGGYKAFAADWLFSLLAASSIGICATSFESIC